MRIDSVDFSNSLGSDRYIMSANLMTPEILPFLMPQVSIVVHPMKMMPMTGLSGFQIRQKIPGKVMLVQTGIRPVTGVIILSPLQQTMWLFQM